MPKSRIVQEITTHAMITREAIPEKLVTEQEALQGK